MSIDLINVEGNLNNLLERLRKVPKRKTTPLTHKLHTENKLSKKTLFYIKEYGNNSNVVGTIVKESILVLFFASLLSSLGGFALESVKGIFIDLLPLIILLPVLNGMAGNYGTIISSRLSTIIHTQGGLKGGIKNKEIGKLYFQIKVISILIALFAIAAAFIITYFRGGSLDFWIFGKIFLIILIDITILVNVIFFMSVFLSVYFYKRGKDPDNVLIPITTAVADFGNMTILTLLVILFF